MFPLWFILELLVFVKLVGLYGFFNIFALYALPSALGFMILIYYPKTLLSSLQKTLSLNQKPNRGMLHSLLIIISGLLFIIPSMVTRLIGLLLFLPIFRHILVFVLLWKWFRFSGKVMGSFQNINFQNFGANGFSMHTGFYSNIGGQKTATQNHNNSLNTNSSDSLDSSTTSTVYPGTPPSPSTDIIDVTPKKPK